MKYLLLTWLLLAALLPAPRARAQCSYPVVPGISAGFRVFVPNTPQELTVLCAGSTVELRDASGRTLDPQQVYYKLTDAATCAPPFTAADRTTLLTVPATPGRVRIHQLTPNTSPGGTGGILFVRELEVRARPAVPAFTLAICGVARNQVQVSIPAQSGVQYFVQVGGGPRSAATATGGVYPLPPGASTVTVTAGYPDLVLCETTAAAQPIPNPTPSRPVLQQLMVRGAALEFGFTALQPEFRYQLLQNGAPIAAVPPGSSFTLAGGSLVSCYALQLRDQCGNALLSSEPLCPVNLTATAADRRNVLSWSVPAGSAVSGFDISRDGQPLASLGAGVGSYTDEQVTCGRSYRYRVTARVGAAKSVSDERTVTTVATTAPPLPLLTASFTLTGAVELALLGPARDTADRLLVRRTLGGSAPQELSLGRTLPLLDPLPVAPTIGTVPCYSARFRDPCNNFSAPSAPACPPVLEAAPVASDPEGNTVQLAWSAPAGQGSNWRYRLLLLDADQRPVGSITPAAGTTDLRDSGRPSDPQILRYRLEATGTAPNGASLTVFSNVATVTRAVRIVVPTAFTPNGDGRNDVLLPKGRFLRELTFTIHDRNGQTVFRSTDPRQGWDGRVNGILAAPQVFTYQVDVVDETGRRVTQRGTVTVLR
ncbi:T9SS type B sorting domain-containing protein [Hymenobacter sp. B81]|uniref:T9SS type B sorting domain-containing protein n=1 Tax=Hymenobacter sp. B81 TaxID=3344878 RepID=UPI0037DD74EF